MQLSSSTTVLLVKATNIYIYAYIQVEALNPLADAQALLRELKLTGL